MRKEDSGPHTGGNLRIAEAGEGASPRRLILFWVVTRLWISFWAVLCSAGYPRSSLEQTIRLSPAGQPLAGWLDRIILAPWDRWDFEYFIKIAESGYRIDDGTLTFLPLYPILGKVTGLFFGGSSRWGLFVISNLSGLLFLLVLERLARLDLPAEASRRAAIYFFSLPAAFIIFAPYTESVFLLLSALSLLKAGERRFWQAGVFGGLAALTRQQGLFLVVPLAWELWCSLKEEKRDSSISALVSGIVRLGLVPAGFVIWLLYRAFSMSDLTLDWRHPETLVYGLLLSRSSTELVTDQHFVFPWQAASLALRAYDSANLIDLIAGAIYLVIFAIGARTLWRIRRSWFLYSLIILLVSFSLTTGEPHSYMGLPRHCLLAFPLVMPLAVWGQNKAVHLTLCAIGLISLFAFSLLYVCKILWVP